jgi:integrase
MAEQQEQAQRRATLRAATDAVLAEWEAERRHQAEAEARRRLRAWHDLRHTALTHEAAAGNPQAYVQLKAGHSQGSITERYIHAAQVLFPGAAARGEERMFGAGSKSGRATSRRAATRANKRPALAGLLQ